MSLKSFLSMQALASAMSQLKQVEAKLEEHLSEDKTKFEAELREAIEHWKELVAHLRTKADPVVVAHIDAGAPPHQAFDLAQAGVEPRAADGFLEKAKV